MKLGKRWGEEEKDGFTYADFIVATLSKRFKPEMPDGEDGFPKTFCEFSDKVLELN